jgi:glycosyltransferase involved in cell wall biosynthesis
MRILQVVHDFLPHSVAGVEVYTLELSLELVRRGHDVTILHATRGPGQTQYDLAEGEVQGLPVRRMVQNYPYRPLDEVALDPQAERRFEEVVRELAPDVVHFQHLWGWSAALPALARRHGAAAVVHLHDHWLVCPSGGQRFHPDGIFCEDLGRVDCDACYARFRSREGPLERLALRAARRIPPPFPPDILHRSFAALPDGARSLLKRANAGRRPAGSPAPALVASDRRALYLEALAEADAFVSPSMDLARRMATQGYPFALHVPNGTSLGRGDEPLPGVAAPDRPLSLLFLGSPLPHKGVHVLAEAASRVTPRVCLEVCGERPAPEYRKQLERAGASWRAPAGRHEIAALVDRADLLCLPSLWPENAPLTLLEARARRRPVLASDIGGIPETAQGRLLPPGDVDRWTEAIDELARDRAALAGLSDAITPPVTSAENARAIINIYRDAVR